jgi:glutamine synthetase
VPQSPDTILRRATHLLEDRGGVGLRAFGEVEFFLGRAPQDADLRAGADEGYHATAPVVFGEEVRRLAQALLVRMGIPVKYAHAEVGWIGPEEGEGLVWEQHEIELAPAPLPDAADAVVLTQWVLRNLARSAGLRCVTDPIVVRGHAGNGLHVHFVPVRDGDPVPVREPDGRLSGPARWLVGGLVRTGGGLMAFGNRSPDSFTRLRQAREAPAGITWGEHDRSALVRLPVGVRGEDGAERHPRTVEFRLPDGSAFPHLLLAGVAMAMLRARDDAELEPLLDSTASGDGEKGSDLRALPGRPAEVGAALAEARDALEREGVFPSAYVGRLIEHLGAGGDGSS